MFKISKKNLRQIGALILMCFALDHLGSLTKRCLYLNISSSMPEGIYKAVDAHIVKEGDIVVFPIPENISAFAKRVEWLRSRKLLLKRVVGTSGDSVCFYGEGAIVSGRKFFAMKTDSAGHSLPREKSRCVVLSNGELFVAGDSATSFDSRYFGPILSSEVVSVVVPIFTQ